MSLAETRHGSFPYRDDQVVRLVGGLVGFTDLTRFLLLECPDIAPLRLLAAVERPEVSLFVIEPRLLVREYAFSLSEEERSRLELAEGEEAELLALAVAVVGERPAESTCNLKAPIVVNTRKMLGAQIVLNDSSYGIRHPLLAEERAGCSS